MGRAAVLALAVLPVAAHAAEPWDVQQSELCLAAIATAEKSFALPDKLLGTIAKVESGRPVGSLTDIRPWPWTINADGEGQFYDTKAQAVAGAIAGFAHGVKRMDIGCMQVNLQAHPTAFTSLDQAFDPVANTSYAAKYLRALNAEAGGDWTVATGLYHSHTPALAASYRERVAAVGAGILTGVGGPEPLYQRAIRRGTLRIALANGNVLLVRTTRQPAGRHPRTKSPCEVAAILAPLLNQPPKRCSRS